MGSRTSPSRVGLTVQVSESSGQDGLMVQLLVTIPEKLFRRKDSRGGLPKRRYESSLYQVQKEIGQVSSGRLLLLLPGNIQCIQILGSLPPSILLTRRTIRWLVPYSGYLPLQCVSLCFIFSFSNLSNFDLPADRLRKSISVDKNLLSIILLTCWPHFTSVDQRDSFIIISLHAFNFNAYILLPRDWVQCACFTYRCLC